MEKFISDKPGKVYILRLDPGDMFVEAIEGFIADEGIDNAVILSGIGSLRDVTVLMPEDTNYPAKLVSKTFTDTPFEIAGVDGFIAGGQAHIHFVLGSKDIVLAGHAGKNCKVLYLAEIVIQSLGGMNIERQPNDKGTMMLCQK